MEYSTSSGADAHGNGACTQIPHAGEDADRREKGEDVLLSKRDIVPDNEEDDDVPTEKSIIAELDRQASSQPGNASPVAPTMTTMPNTPRTVSPEDSNGAAEHSPCPLSTDVDGSSDDGSSDVGADCGLGKKRGADRSPSVVSLDDELTGGDSRDHVSHKRQKFA